jgi:hypothetical protein
MFPTDELIEKATTTTTNWATLIPKLWANRIERNLRKRSVFLPTLTVFDDLLVPGAGDLLHVPFLQDLGAVPSLTEGTAMTVNAMPNSTEIQLTPTEYGMMYSVTRKMLDRIKYAGIAEIFDRFSYSMEQTIEGQCAALATATVPTAGGTLTQIYANGKTSSTITSSDTFNDKLILDGIAYLRGLNNVPFDDGYFILYITPGQWEALWQDSNIRTDLRFAEPSLLLSQNSDLNGVVANLHGCHVIVTNYVTSQTENSITDYNALLVAPRWGCITWKRRPEALIDPTLYDLGRIRQMGITADFAINLFHNERAVVLKSA